MATNLINQIKAAMISAMREKRGADLSTIRMLQAAIKQKEIDERVVATESVVLAIIEKMIKQREESIRLFETGNRTELAAKEQAEIKTLQAFLPEPLSPQALEDLITNAIAEAKATSVKDMGRVMALLKPKIQGRAPVSTASAIIKSRLDR